MEVVGGWSFKLFLHVQFNSEHKFGAVGYWGGGSSPAQGTGCMTCSLRFEFSDPVLVFRLATVGEFTAWKLARATDQGFIMCETLFELKANTWAMTQTSC